MGAREVRSKGGFRGGDDGDLLPRGEPNFAPDPDGLTDYSNPYLFTGRTGDILDNSSLKIQYNFKPILRPIHRKSVVKVIIIELGANSEMLLASEMAIARRTIQTTR
ncbi:MAG: hypothetical protein JSU94_17355 [Phycisphaerales bacterium]|nr:MAG: hypothetical protein JSU94_17355 [Phycisphaerales bacterium]